MKQRSELKEPGFSLIELMVVVGFIAFLGMFMGNAFDAGSYFAGYRLKSATSELAFALQQAKMEAIKRNVFCTITFNQPVEGTTYDYIVYTDEAQNLEYESSQDTVLKKVSLSNYPGISVDSNTFAQNDSGRPSLAFDPKGFSKSNSLGMGMGTIVLRNSSGKRRMVVVNGLGRIRTDDDGW